VKLKDAQKNVHSAQIIGQEAGGNVKNLQTIAEIERM